MSTPQKNSQPKQPAKPNALVAELAAMEGIPVYELIFAVGMNNKPDLPHLESKGGMGRLRYKEDISITYLPKLALHRIVKTSRDPKVGTKTFYVPATWATFEPLE